MLNGYGRWASRLPATLADDARRLRIFRETERPARQASVLFHRLFSLFPQNLQR
jgi:hypothetical protein